MQPWIWIAAWLAINLLYVLVAILRARRRPPADGGAGAAGVIGEGRVADPKAVD